jgi:hypothetical protein
VPPTFDAAAIASANSGPVISWNHTIGAGANRCLVVWVGQGRSGTPQTINSVAINAVPLAVVPSSAASDGNFVHIVAYYLVAPASGTFSISVTLSAAGDQLVAGSMSFSGVDQSVPLNTAVPNNGSGLTASTTCNSGTGEIVTCGVMTDSLNITVGTGTSRFELDSIGSDTSFGGSTATGGTTVTPTWTLDQSTAWAISAVSIRGL